EHILPETPDASWSHIKPEVGVAYYKRIGNLTLLNAEQNGALNNSAFSVKREAFCNSAMLLNRNICETTTPTTKWDVENITERQKYLAEEAVKIWALMPKK